MWSLELPSEKFQCPYKSSTLCGHCREFQKSCASLHRCHGGLACNVACTPQLLAAERADLDCQGGNDGLRMDQGGVAQVVQSVLHQ